MIERTFGDLVRDLRQRRRNGELPPVLLLGAGTSKDSGIGAMEELYAFFNVKDFEGFAQFIGPTSPGERYRYLAEFLQKREPTQVSPGYQALATLCAQNYFDLVLTTNMDVLLEDALAAVRPPLWRKDFLLLVNGVIRPDRLGVLLRGRTPRVKVVKLHGEIFQPFMAWTVEEMEVFLTEIGPDLKPALHGRDVLVVGHSLRDARIRELAETTGGDFWFTHPVAVPDHLKNNATMRAVVTPEAGFEQLFAALAHEFLLDAAATGVPVEPARVAPATPSEPLGRTQAATSLDDLMACVLAVVGDGGAPSSTAFVLDQPRVIVCDAYAVKSLIDVHGEVWLLAADGRRFKTRVLRTNRAHVFGPTLLAVPDELQVPGLRLNPSTVLPGEVVHVVVAAGEKTGVSTGAATTVVAVSSRIEPIGLVHDLAAIEIVMRGGSSGAPVVDQAMAVRGFIVAGSLNEAAPESLTYPTQYWADFVMGRSAAPDTSSSVAPRPRGRSSRRTPRRSPPSP